MPIDTLQRFREATRRLSGAEAKKPWGDPLERIRAGAVELIALASQGHVVSKEKGRLERLLIQIRAAAEEFRVATERHIAGVLALADEAAGIWEATWEAALRNPAKDRATEAEMLRWLLEDTGQVLIEAFGDAQTHADIFERPLARLDELKTRTEEFPLWARGCLARWEMLDGPAPTLDPVRVARAQAAYGRGECEDIDDVLSRVETGGLWVKE